MKLNIKLDDSVKIKSPIYSFVLKQKIISVINKIGRDRFDKVKWIIFDAKNLNKRKFSSLLNIPSVYIVRQGKDYGFCIYEECEIWISTVTIQSSGLFEQNIKTLVPELNNSDFLADVIIDELTHIMTGKDHGSKEYDMQFNEYHNRYYNRL
ncbi:MAG: hypothetical protein APF81_17350 [Desulfosporosinus sp. BRH_c37]|nr:MAG: hypothetical protein APF81_17350 [Desulfosporosinus sp. BRH_c37]